MKARAVPPQLQPEEISFEGRHDHFISENKINNPLPIFPINYNKNTSFKTFDFRVKTYSGLSYVAVSMFSSENTAQDDAGYGEEGDKVAGEDHDPGSPGVVGE